MRVQAMDADWIVLRLSSANQLSSTFRKGQKCVKTINDTWPNIEKWYVTEQMQFGLLLEKANKYHTMWHSLTGFSGCWWATLLLGGWPELLTANTQNMWVMLLKSYCEIFFSVKGATRAGLIFVSQNLVLMLSCLWSFQCKTSSVHCSSL